jgi:hypothetical protein
MGDVKITNLWNVLLLSILWLLTFFGHLLFWWVLIKDTIHRGTLMTHWHVFLRIIIWVVMIICCLRKIKLYSKYKDFRKYNPIFSNKSGFDGHDKVNLCQFLTCDFILQQANVFLGYFIISWHHWHVSKHYKMWPNGV